MQLAFYKAPGTWADKAIRVFTGSKYSHVELVIGTECWSASARDGFVRAKTMWLDPDKWDVIDIHGAEPFALAWFTQHAGQRYDWAGVARFVLPLLPNSRNRWFCSEAVAAALGFASSAADWTPGELADFYTHPLEPHHVSDTPAPSTPQPEPHAAAAASAAALADKVAGPTSATDNTLARFDGTTGKLLQGSNVVIDDSGNLDTPGQIFANGRGATKGFATPDWLIYNTSSGNALAFNNGSDRIKFDSFGNADIIGGNIGRTSEASGIFLNTNSVLPGTGTGATDNTVTLGSASYRWSQVYAAIGTINTSDAREKTAVRVMAADEIEAAKALSKEIGVYQFLASVEAKGDKARHHIGMTVQRAIEIMKHHGLDPFSYGFICYDKWDEETREHPAIEARDAVEAKNAVLDDEGNVIEPAVEAQPAIKAKDAWTEVTQQAGDRYSFRYDQLTLFIARGIDARLVALDQPNTQPQGTTMNLDQMRKDWADFWATTPPGTNLPYAGGTLSVLKDGSAIWGDGVFPMGLTFNRDTPFSVIAGRSQAIADLWREQYGYVPPPIAATGAVFG